MAKSDDTAGCLFWVGVGIIVWKPVILLFIIGIIAIIAYFAIFVNDTSEAKYALHKGKKLLQKKNYKDAIKEFDKIIMNTRIKSGDAYLYRGLAYFMLKEKKYAIQDLKTALQYINEDKKRKECSTLIQQIESSIQNKQKERKAETIKPFHLENATAKELTALKGFDNNKVLKFKSLVQEGVMWYDIETFAMEFNLQPHEIIMNEDLIIFPDKPEVKLGKRKLDI